MSTKKKKEYRVMLLEQHTYFVEAKDEDSARDKAEQLWGTDNVPPDDSGLLSVEVEEVDEP